MPQRTFLVLIWLLATGLATGVGFLAVSLVGDVVRGAGPLGASYRTPGPGSESTSATSVRRDVRVEQVSLVAQCRGRQATLLEAEAVPPWRVTETEVGPDEDVEVVLARDGERVRVEVYCNRGRPREVIFD